MNWAHQPGHGRLSFPPQVSVTPMPWTFFYSILTPRKDLLLQTFLHPTSCLEVLFTVKLHSQLAIKVVIENKVADYWLGRVVGDNGWTQPSTWLPTTRQWDLPCQKGLLPIEQQVPGRPNQCRLGNNTYFITLQWEGHLVQLFPHVLVAFMFCCVRNRIKLFLDLKPVFGQKSFSSEVCL